MNDDLICQKAIASVLEERPVHAAELWRRYSRTEPDTTVENELVQQYLPLVKTIVGRMAMVLPSHVDQQDLHSAGLVGLLEAIRRYDPTSGVNFDAYARKRIRGAVLDELRRMDWIPRSVHRKARKVEAAIRELQQETGEVPSEKQVAQGLGLSLEDYQELQKEIRPATYVSLDSVRAAESEGGLSMRESLPDDRQVNPGDEVAKREMIRLIAEQIKHLPETYRKVLSLYYFEDLRLREIAAVFGVTESRISQIHTQAILAIRAALPE